MKVPIILLLSGLFFLILGGAWFWQEVDNYKTLKKQGKVKRWWITEIIDTFLFGFGSSGVIGSIGCFLFGILLIVLAMVGFNHGLEFQK